MGQKKLYDIQKQQKEKEKSQKEVSKLRRSIASKEKERITLKERLNSTKPLDDLREQESELERQVDDNEVKEPNKLNVKRRLHSSEQRLQREKKKAWRY